MRVIHSIAMITILVALLAIVSCAGNSTGNGSPASPDIQQAVQATPSATDNQAGHYLWGWYMIYADPANNVYEVTPVREATKHWNVLKFLEQGPCVNCFRITGVKPGPDHTLDIDVAIQHPFTAANLTGFDVRGIAIFDGSRPFAVSGLNVPDRILGDGELVNADGYTTLFNANTAGSGPGGLEGYLKGTKATSKVPSAMLNGFKRYASTSAGNTRDAFLAGDTITVTNRVDMPDGGLTFGYAVDASWASPITKPVTNPMQDFGLDANSPEAWKIDVTEAPFGDGLTECGGSTLLTMQVFDWQGKDDVHPVVLECPSIFEGTIQATWKSDSTGYSTYEATVTNTRPAQPGTYKCLISKEAAENDAGKPWMNLTAYQIYQLVVIDHPDNPPTASLQASKPDAAQNEVLDFDASASTDNDCDGNSIVKYEWDWNGDGTFVEGTVQMSHSWADIATYNVQLRVTDDEGTTATLPTPLAIPVHVYTNAAPVISSVTHSRTTSQRSSTKETVTLGVVFDDPDSGDTHTYLWTCPVGKFDDPTLPAPTWTSPSTVGKYDITVRVTDKGGLYDEGTCKQWVTKWPTLTNASAPGNLVFSQSLDSLDAGPVNPSDYKWPTTQPNGTVVYMNFYATWCGPCMGEMQELSDMYQAYKDNPEYAQLLIDLQESKSTVQNWHDGTSYEATHWLLDTSGAYYTKSDKWVPSGNQGYIPTHLIFDRDGHCRGQIVGGLSSTAQLIAYFDELL